MMNRRFSLTTLLAFMLFVSGGCGTGTSDLAGSSSQLSTVQGSSPSSVSGAYQMQLFQDQFLEFVLVEESNRLVGDGAVFVGDNPLPVRLHGTMQNDGAAVIILNSLDKEGEFNETRLVLNLMEPGQVSVTDIDDLVVLPEQTIERVPNEDLLDLPTSLNLTLSSPRQSFPIQVTLDTLSPAGGYQGSWEIPSSSPSLQLVNTPFRLGRADVFLSGQSNWARLSLLDPNGVLVLGTVWFQLGEGTPDVDPDSTLFTSNGLEFVDD